jgi:DNA-binding HxlR family transcriptional regulator
VGVPSRPDFAGLPCSIARALDLVGEGWTLLILRDAFLGLRRFDEFQTSLGVATNVLTARLKRMTDAGLLERRLYQERPPRYEYLATRKARDLRPVLIGLLQWGDRYLAGPEGPPRVLVHETCGHRTRPKLVCSHCEQVVGNGEIRAIDGPPTAVRASPRKGRPARRGAHPAARGRRA